MFKVGDKIKLKPFETQVEIDKEKCGKFSKVLEDYHFDMVYTITEISSFAKDPISKYGELLSIEPEIGVDWTPVEYRFVLAQKNLFETEE